MSLQIVCPHCETALRVPDEPAALRIVCPRCGGATPHPDADQSCYTLEPRCETVEAIAEDDDFRRRWLASPNMRQVLMLAWLGDLVLAGIIGHYLAMPWFALALAFSLAGVGYVAVVAIEQTEHALSRAISWTFLIVLAALGTLTLLCLAILVVAAPCLFGLAFRPWR